MTINTWQKNLVVYFLIFLAVLCVNFNNIIEALHHHYYVYEQDAYMHLVMATDLLNHNDWYNHFTSRVNAPYGITMHSWTHVINAILIGGALALKSFMPVSSALYLWSFIVPMLFNAIAAAGMLWAIQILNPGLYQQLFIIAAFLLNPFLNSFFSPLMVNYHFVLITLSIFYWGYLLRLIMSRNIRLVIPVAILACLGIWTSISFIIMIFIGLAFLAWMAIIQAQIRMTIITALLAAICIGLALVIRIEHHHFLTVTHDIVSVVHLLFFMLLLFGSIIYSICLQQSGKAMAMIMIPIIMVMIFLTMNHIFPGFYKGPYNNVSPWLLTHFFPKTSKFYSPFSIDNSLTLALLCYFFIGMAWFYYLCINHTPWNPGINLLLWAATITTALAIYMYRWCEFSVPLSILLVSFVVEQSCRKGIKILLIAFMASLPTLIFLLTRPYVPTSHLACQQQFHDMLQNKFLESPQFHQDKIMFIHSNYGPALLYGSHFSVVATNDHHNPQGVKDSFDFFTFTEQPARDIVSRRKIDLILLCQPEFPRGFNPDKGAWLHPVPLPEQYKLWHLYRLERDTQS